MNTILTGSGSFAKISACQDLRSPLVPDQNLRWGGAVHRILRKPNNLNPFERRCCFALSARRRRLLENASCLCFPAEISTNISAPIAARPPAPKPIKDKAKFACLLRKFRSCLLFPPSVSRIPSGLRLLSALEQPNPDKRIGRALPEFAFVILIWLTTATQAYAVRPFVTDDARIIDYGQIEIENWIETTHALGEWAPAPGFNVIGGIGLTDWLEVLAGSGVGRDPEHKLTIGNPVLMSKFLLKPAVVNGHPGYAISAGSVFDSGRGSMYGKGTVYNLIGMTTYRLYEDRINLHINLGVRTDKERDGRRNTRPVWGVGASLEVLPQLQVIGEVYAGDPLVLNAPKYAVQSGLRWLYSDYLQVDLTLGTEPKLDARQRETGTFERSGQIGIRFLFDVFTRHGRPGNPEGARGLF
jgi:hypothetical protein